MPLVGVNDAARTHSEKGGKATGDSRRSDAYHFNVLRMPSCCLDLPVLLPYGIFADLVTMPQRRRWSILSSPVGATYTAIVRPAPLQSRRSSSTPRSDRISKELKRSPLMSTSSPKAQATSILSPIPANLADEASADRRSPDRHHDEKLRQQSGSPRARKRDKVRMVGHNLQNAFKSWFKEVSISSLLLEHLAKKLPLTRRRNQMVPLSFHIRYLRSI